MVSREMRPFVAGVAHGRLAAVAGLVERAVRQSDQHRPRQAADRCRPRPGRSGPPARPAPPTRRSRPSSADRLDVAQRRRLAGSRAPRRSRRSGSADALIWWARIHMAASCRRVCSLRVGDRLQRVAEAEPAAALDLAEHQGDALVADLGRDDVELAEPSTASCASRICRPWRSSSRQREILAAYADLLFRLRSAHRSDSLDLVGGRIRTRSEIDRGRRNLWTTASRGLWTGARRRRIQRASASAVALPGATGRLPHRIRHGKRRLCTDRVKPTRHGMGSGDRPGSGRADRPGQLGLGTSRSLCAISSMETSRKVSTFALFTKRAGRYMSHTQASPIDTS